MVEDARDLDGIIRAHDTYLHTILEKAFLAQDKYALHNALLKVGRQAGRQAGRQPHRIWPPRVEGGPA